ncbi:MAG: hypothetical protein DMG85_21225 [Acidobacteria bacterium]|nr:MAG: hypothetical protein DMG85_21225 [Acidobacteriota bacterium]
MPRIDQAGLVRAIGRWSLVALVVNSIIGSGVFGLPSVLAGLLGAASPWAVLLAGAAVGIIIACFAEVASQFAQAGGPYLYARVAFGRMMGIQVGWMLWLAQLAAPAANANLFVIYLGEFCPNVTRPGPRFLILTLLVGVLAFVNYRGVRAGAQVSNVFTVAKLVPLAIVIIAGMFYLLGGHHDAPRLPSSGDAGAWLKAMLLLVFAYGGFETALTPMAEAKDPRRDTVFALFIALIICTVLYTSTQWIVIGALPDAAKSARPLADAARLILGSKGAALVAIGALVSCYGYLSAPRFRTPYFSVLLFAFLIWILSLFGNFSWNLTLSAVARLFYYAVGCAALPVLRKKQPEVERFRLPGGTFFAALGVVICLVLITRVDLSGSIILLATIVAAFINWLWVRNQPISART